MAEEVALAETEVAEVALAVAEVGSEETEVVAVASVVAEVASAETEVDSEVEEVVPPTLSSLPTEAASSPSRDRDRLSERVR